MTTNLRSSFSESNNSMRKELIQENHLHPVVPRWFAVWVEVKREKRVFEFLQKKNIESYLPLQKKRKHYTKRKPEWVEIPLLRGYVFVRIVQDDYCCVLQTQHVKNFLKIRKNLLAIPDAEIDLLKRFLGQQDYEVSLLKNEWTPGDRVRIVQGPLVGQEGVLVKKKNKRFFVVQLEIVGEKLGIGIEVPENFLEKLL